MRRISLLATVAGLIMTGSGRARADLAVRFTSATSSTTTRNDSLGFSFTTNTAVTVSALDYIGQGQGGDVRLYNGSGTTLASATVTTSDPTESVGGFTYHVHTLGTSLMLAAQTTYYIAGDVPAASQLVPYLAKGLTTDSRLSYGGGVSKFGTYGNPTTDESQGNLNPSFFPVNLDLSPAVATPEPSTIALALSALPLGGAWLWKRRRQARIVLD